MTKEEKKELLLTKTFWYCIVEKKKSIYQALVDAGGIQDALSGACKMLGVDSEILVEAAAMQLSEEEQNQALLLYASLRSKDCTQDVVKKITEQ